MRLQRDSNPWPPRYRCDALPTELWSLVGSRSGASSIYTRYMKRMMWSHMSELRIENRTERDLRSCVVKILTLSYTLHNISYMYSKQIISLVQKLHSVYDLQVILEGERGFNYQGDAAVDDIMFHSLAYCQLSPLNTTPTLPTIIPSPPHVTSPAPPTHYLAQATL